MKSVTDHILEQTSRFVRVPEGTPGREEWSMFTDAGAEVEVGEFLFSLVRMIKPSQILETGTHVGVSSAYMGLALQQNQKGNILTFEVIKKHLDDAKKVWQDLGILNYIDGNLIDSRKFNPGDLSFDMLFLDSEPQFRFDEFIKFYPSLIPGGFIVIHDLNETFGHHGSTYHGVYDWPYGDFREKIGPYILDHSVQAISFPTPRGLTMFQKTSPSFEVTKHLTYTA